MHIANRVYISSGRTFLGDFGRQLEDELFHCQKNNDPKIAPIIARIINAGMDAIAHLTINITMSPKGISKLITWTLLSFISLSDC